MPPVATVSAANQKPRMRAGDVFLHLGAFGSLFICIGAILSLLYIVINAAFPPVTASMYSYFIPSSISFEVATLIVFLPIFLVLSNINQNRYAADPQLKETSTRRGLIFLTLLISGFSMAGDLVTVIYSFLNGDDFTASFVLKALSVLVVFGGVFLYYILDVRNKLTMKSRNLLRLLAIVLTLSTIVWGFAVLGSPRTQRNQNMDRVTVSNLEQIQSQVTSSYQQKGVLPATLADLNNSLSYMTVPKDPTTGKDYEYTKTGTLTFNLCADFKANPPTQPTSPYSFGLGSSDNWKYTKGHYCFARTIDPQLYPVYNTAVIK